MPKNTPLRRIDQKRDRVSGVFTIGSGGGGAGGVTDHGALTGLTDDDHSQYYNQPRGDARFVRQVRSIATTAPLRIAGGASADLSDDRTLSINIDSSGGLETSSGNLRVKLPTNSGITRDATGLLLSPSTVSQSSSNAVSGAGHTHAVTSSSNPGAATSLLASDASGFLTLVRLIASQRVRTPIVDTASGNLLLDPASGITQVDDDLLVDQDAAITRHLAVATNALLVDGLNKNVGVNTTPSGAGLDVRAGSTSHHTIRLKQIASQTGRLWRVENTSGQELIVLDSVGNLQSGNPGYVSGLTGWQMTPWGRLEALDGVFRGELRATVMTFGEVSVENGTKLVTKHGAALELDVTLVSTATVVRFEVESTAFSDQDYLNVESTAFGDQNYLDSQTIENRLHVKNPYTGHYQLFGAGEVLQMKTWTGTAVTDTWLKVNSARDEGTHWSYAVTVVSGTLPATYTTGAAIAGYGEVGDGAIRISADDPNGPLIDIFTTGAQPWVSDIYPHVRLGRLDGVGVTGVSGAKQWGMVAGANLADANSPYVVLSNLQQYMYKVRSEWHDGTNTTGRIEPSGRVRFGTNVDSQATTFMDVDPATGTATFRGAIEVLSGNIPSGVISGLGALATQNNLDGVPNGSTYSRVNSTIINGGNIRVGTGTKDSTLNGWHIDSSEIVGQASGVDQVVLGTDGKIGFAGGNGVLDSAGIGISIPNSAQDYAGYRFFDGSSIIGGLFQYYGTTGVSAYLSLLAGKSFSGSAARSIAHMIISSHSNNSGSPSSRVLLSAYRTSTTAPYVSVVNETATSNVTIGAGAITLVTDSTSGAINLYGQVEAYNMLNVETTAW
jgi:hypothetical protein